MEQTRSYRPLCLSLYLNYFVHGIGVLILAQNMDFSGYFLSHQSVAYKVRCCRGSNAGLGSSFLNELLLHRFFGLRLLHRLHYEKRRSPHYTSCCIHSDIHLGNRRSVLLSVRFPGSDSLGGRRLLRCRRRYAARFGYDDGNVPQGQRYYDRYFLYYRLHCFLYHSRCYRVYGR